MDAVIAVRRRIARAIVGAEDGTGARSEVADAQRDDTVARLGDVVLHPHQSEAVRRLLEALREHGGALLADAPGLGKTFVALAVARAYGGAVVAAPATLKGQWMQSAALTNVRIHWVSMETLSRRPVTSDEPLFIADEAHHLRTPSTRRYAHAAALCVGRRVLLLSATPVHNRPADRDALLALFLGEAAAHLPAGVLSRLIVRREADAALLPRRGAVRWLSVPAHVEVGAALRALPPPLPASDGRTAVALLRLTLAHAWSSSLAALDDTARRIILRASTIDDALRAGRWPTRRELGAWLLTTDAAQLAFPELVATRASLDCAAAQETLATHRRAMRALRSRVAAAREDDTAARAQRLREVVARHRGETVVAFSRYAGTIDALWRALRVDAGVVAVTGRGVKSAGGGLSRREILALLATARPKDARMPLRLVLCTELLGEGLDLRAASVIVHLDQPWTPARLDQREGRAARLGSTHAKVTVYAMRPPRGAMRLLTLGDRLRSKRTAMAAGMAEGTAREALIALVRPWLSAVPGPAKVAAVRAAHDGFIAAIRDASGRTRVVLSDGTAIVEDDARLLNALRLTEGAAPVAIPMQRVRAARRAIREWQRSESSAVLARSMEAGQRTRMAIGRRLDDALREAPLHRRMTVQSQVAASLARLRTMRGAGVERALDAAARLESVEELLAAVQSMGRAQASEGPATQPVRLLALLLLSGRSDPAPRSAASSGTAAPR